MRHAPETSGCADSYPLFSLCLVGHPRYWGMQTPKYNHLGRFGWHMELANTTPCYLILLVVVSRKLRQQFRYLRPVHHHGSFGHVDFESAAYILQMKKDSSRNQLQLARGFKRGCNNAMIRECGKSTSSLRELHCNQGKFTYWNPKLLERLPGKKFLANN